jgi:hypothetical protein
VAVAGRPRRQGLTSPGTNRSGGDENLLLLGLFALARGLLFFPGLMWQGCTARRLLFLLACGGWPDGGGRKKRSRAEGAWMIDRSLVARRGCGCGCGECGPAGRQHEAKAAFLFPSFVRLHLDGSARERREAALRLRHLHAAAGSGTPVWWQAGALTPPVFDCARAHRHVRA